MVHGVSLGATVTLGSCEWCSVGWTVRNLADCTWRAHCLSITRGQTFLSASSHSHFIKHFFKLKNDNITILKFNYNS